MEGYGEGSMKIVNISVEFARRSGSHKVVNAILFLVIRELCVKAHERSELVIY